MSMTMMEELTSVDRLPEPDLAYLLTQVGRGDERAFTSLYGFTSARIFGLVRRIIVDPAISEEVTQEVFLQVWNKAAEFSPALGSPIAWLMTLAHRRAVDRIRSEQAHRNRLTRWSTSEVLTPFDNVMESVLARDESQAVQAAFGTLTEKQRQAIEMAYYKGLTYAQVAEALEAPLGTVKARIRDGLGRLKDALEPYSSLAP
ncbi:ECF RNA polymerase sigma factor SigK [Arthrobacter tumbae]|uniref:ECF RNA polymerase sigma factor SigK n=1 Tax=Arthrobacter tumbae TaxID=163874 RepID=UPI001EF925C2|nr:ECF RNA polymerase sigma factor SigK [Arthrobacter tumbae]MBM7781609.1 RNA polymerase sigma-70 factor (ECF subfamily) [Arthrobacter tumbae]